MMIMISTMIITMTTVITLSSLSSHDDLAVGLYDQMYVMKWLTWCASSSKHLVVTDRAAELPSVVDCTNQPYVMKWLSWCASGSKTSGGD